jgi:hypothetical protein
MGGLRCKLFLSCTVTTDLDFRLGHKLQALAPSTIAITAAATEQTDRPRQRRRSLLQSQSLPLEDCTCVVVLLTELTQTAQKQVLEEIRLALNARIGILVVTPMVVRSTTGNADSNRSAKIKQLSQAVTDKLGVGLGRDFVEQAKLVELWTTDTEVRVALMQVHVHCAQHAGFIWPAYLSKDEAAIRIQRMLRNAATIVHAQKTEHVVHFSRIDNTAPIKSMDVTNRLAALAEARPTHHEPDVGIWQDVHRDIDRDLRAVDIDV